MEVLFALPWKNIQFLLEKITERQHQTAQGTAGSLVTLLNILFLVFIHCFCIYIS